MKKITVAFLTLLVISSCVNNSIPEESYMISRDTLVLVIADMHKTDALLMNSGMLDRNLRKKNASYYNHIYKKYHITEYRFGRTIQTYTTYPEEYFEVYDDVLDILSEELAKIDTLNIKEIEKHIKEKAFN